MSAAILLGDLTLVASEQEFAGALALQPLARAERARARCSTSCAPRSPSGSTSTCSRRRCRGATTRPPTRRARARSSAPRPRATASSTRSSSAPRSPTPTRRSSRRAATLGLPLGEAFQLRDDLLGRVRRPADDRQARRATTCARASAPSSPRARSPAPAPRRRRPPSTCCARGSATARSRTPTSSRLADAIRRTGAPDDVEQLIDDAGRRARSRCIDDAAVARAGARPAGRRSRTRRSTGTPERAGRRRPRVRARPAASRRISVLRPARSASIGVPGSESSGVKSHSIAVLVGEPGVRQDRQRALQRGEDRPRLVRVGRGGLRRVRQVPRHEERRRDREDARVAATDADDAALLHDAAHLRRRRGRAGRRRRGR